jgi:nucleotide-binding universal stress UspA family protein
MRILVGYDGSDGAKRALDRAVQEARADHARITVLVVAELPLDPQGPRNFGTLGDIGAWEDRPLDAPEAVIKELAEARDQLEAAGARGDLAWATGTPGRAIVDTAKDLHARLIVVGEHHHSMLGRFFGTDTAEEIQRHAGCDVLVV